MKVVSLSSQPGEDPIMLLERKRQAYNHLLHCDKTKPFRHLKWEQNPNCTKLNNI